MSSQSKQPEKAPAKSAQNSGGAAAAAAAATPAVLQWSGRLEEDEDVSYHTSDQSEEVEDDVNSTHTERPAGSSVVTAKQPPPLQLSSSAARAVSVARPPTQPAAASYVTIRRPGALSAPPRSAKDYNAQKQSESAYIDQMVRRAAAHIAERARERNMKEGSEEAAARHLKGEQHAMAFAYGLIGAFKCERRSKSPYDGFLYCGVLMMAFIKGAPGLLQEFWEGMSKYAYVKARGQLALTDYIRGFAERAGPAAVRFINAP